ncbi:MAG: AraC family transcriptional regulator [Ewingella americana]|jgi:AraC family transcriptional activator of pyochelin receptor|uniref:helix-turn-helix domain-containing protein n=1 Tax=Ewingella americana TaxID=41202 RepID=UPI00242AFBD9|nr:AraC family transcriptional regulator [Ewingella americana]MCI1676676.1 AraC family transcriptional regulator [Ewingella americana]MCI1853734.1 AraC family transcriptional regulator [Ewingella americana]MCI1860025.1 AraC family transcriptional regulator [Ewingella americana]MCI2142353.1 AraC family transcriptional regulator [Ewingella americana]MCI2163316.1 AraC family transcriptional regulator [Ewingella americana]
MKNSSGEVGKSVNEAIFEGSIAFSSGSICPQNTKWETERLQQGLKIIIVERGELQCKLPGAPASQRISGPCICAVWNQGESEGMQRFEPGRVLEHTAISLSPSAIDSRMAVEVQQQLQQAFQLETSTGPRLMVMASSPAIKALRAQVASCPLQGISRALYLSGKALEIIAYTLDGIAAPPAPTENALLRLSSADLDKLNRAKQLLSERMLNPPTLAELALSVGMNTRKLTVGFRRLFGESVFEYLQSLRLETAWQMLTAGDVSVSTAAYQVGYSPAHFSVAFRKKFGVSPKSLRG